MNEDKLTKVKEGNKKTKKIPKTNNKKNKTVSFNLLEVIVIILITSLVVAVSTGVIVYQNYNEIDNSVSNNSNKDYLKELETAYNNILNSYVEKVDQKELTNAAIDGMYKYLGDPYTSYLDEDTTADLMDRLKGEYKGIGVEITKVDEGILVANVFEKSPAEQAGILMGDLIIKVNGESTLDKTVKEVSNIIKNSDDEIKITVQRSGIEKEISVKSRKVDITSVEKNKIDNVGYLKITTFSNTTYKQFREALESLEKEGINGLVIDLRDNGGGYLNPAVEIAEMFVEKGKNIYGLESKSNVEMYKDSTSESRNYKVSIIMNGGTASASEILTAALKESYNVITVGTTSYGKGTVQDTNELSTGGMVKYTTAYWLTPNGNKINGKGITPDINIESKEGEDLELKAAINAVK